MLGCGEATVRRRLAGAKERLRARLDRRVIALPSSLATLPDGPAFLGRGGAARVAVTDATGLTIARSVANLAAAATGLAWISVWLVAVLVGRGTRPGEHLAGIVIGRPGSLPNPPANPKTVPVPIAAQAPPPNPPAPPAPRSEDEYTFNGRVLDPEGRPFRGAAVYARPGRRPPYTTDATVSDAEGRFRRPEACRST